MNKKGQIASVGMIIIVAVTLIVGAILFTAIAQESGKSTATDTLTNYTITAAANGSSTYITAYKHLTVTSITNGTTGGVIAAGNYTVTNNVVYNGNLAVKVDTAAASEYGEETWAINGVGQPLTYISDSAGRSIVPLIAIFFALAIVVVALTPTLRSGIIDAFS